MQTVIVIQIQVSEPQIYVVHYVNVVIVNFNQWDLDVLTVSYASTVSIVSMKLTVSTVFMK